MTTHADHEPAARATPGSGWRGRGPDAAGGRRPRAGGTGRAVFEGAVPRSPRVLALVVGLALQVGVNFANDYSDGIRGTDATGWPAAPRRVGPGPPGAVTQRGVRLVRGGRRRRPGRWSC